jgi:hypothetical protein
MAREASPATVYIRSLVSADKTITFSGAKDKLAAAGHGDVTESAFNMTKYLWLKKKKEKKQARKAAAAAGTPLPPPKHKKADPAPTPVKVEVSITDALKFVADSGGLGKVKVSLAERRAALERDEALVVAFENLSVQVKAAS